MYTCRWVQVPLEASHPRAGVTDMRSHLARVLGNEPVLLAAESPFRPYCQPHVFSLYIICPLWWTEIPQGQRTLILFASCYIHNLWHLKNRGIYEISHINAIFNSFFKNSSCTPPLPPPKLRTIYQSTQLTYLEPFHHLLILKHMWTSVDSLRIHYGMEDEQV